VAPVTEGFGANSGKIEEDTNKQGWVFAARRRAESELKILTDLIMSSSQTGASNEDVEWAGEMPFNVRRDGERSRGDCIKKELVGRGERNAAHPRGGKEFSSIHFPPKWGEHWPLDNSLS